MDLIVKQSNMADVKYIPKLRFPEFENDGKWKVVKLGDVVTFCNSKCDRSELKIETYISTENILQDFLGVKRAVNLPQNGSFTKFCIGDILVSNIRPYLKKIWQADFDGAASNDVLVFRTKNQNNDKYVAHLLKSDAFVNYCMEGAKGVKMPRGDKALMLEYSIPFPTLPEQQKIASFLTSLDEQISAHTKKLEALKAHKKGLMQQLFPANGEKTPKLRFPEFKNAGEWEEVRLGEIIKECKDVSKVENEDILLSSSIEGIFLNSELFSHQRGVSNIGYRKIKKGMLVLSAQNLHLGNANVNLKYEHGLVSPAYKIFDIVNCNALFVSHWIKKDSTKQLFFDSTTEGASVCRRNVVWNTLYNQTILMPLDSEQQKIASFLSSIDEMIQAQDDKIRKLKTYKNGLMQQMFAK